MDRQGNTPNRYLPLSAFISITFTLSWLMCLVTWLKREDPLAFNIASIVSMWVPGLTGLVIHHWLLKRPFREIGFKLGRFSTYVLAYLIPAVFIAGSFYISYLCGWSSMDRTLSNISNGILVDRPELLGVLIMNMLVTSSTIAVFINVPVAFGEELGWRGFLYEYLKSRSFQYPRLLTNLTWGIWHAPMILLMGLNYPDHRAAGVLWMIVFCLLMGWIFCWLRDRGKSLLPCVLAHASLNAQGQGLFPLLFASKNSLISGPTGVVGMLLLGLIALVLWRLSTGKRRKAHEQAKATSSFADDETIQVN